LTKVTYPKHIKILHKTYDLVERTEPSAIIDMESYGNHYEILNKIEWVRHHHESDNVDTIIHEMLHALYALFRIKEKDTEEEVVSRLSTGLTTLMKDNKPLFRTFLENL